MLSRYNLLKRDNTVKKRHCWPREEAKTDECLGSSFWIGKKEWTRNCLWHNYNAERRNNRAFRKQRTQRVLALAERQPIQPVRKGSERSDSEY